jgi:hypothetical protein
MSRYPQAMQRLGVAAVDAQNRAIEQHRLPNVTLRMQVQRCRKQLLKLVLQSSAPLQRGTGGRVSRSVLHGFRVARRVAAGMIPQWFSFHAKREPVLTDAAQGSLRVSDIVAVTRRSSVRCAG